jgi:hypothetical protein
MVFQQSILSFILSFLLFQVRARPQTYNLSACDNFVLRISSRFAC